MKVEPLNKAGPVSCAVLFFRSSPRIWLALWAAGAVVTAILYLLPETAPPGEYQADKFIHLIVFGALGVPLRSAASRSRDFARLVAINLALAAGLEFAQSFVPGRQFAMFDIAANLFGLGIGIVVGIRIERVAGRWLRTRQAAWSTTTQLRPTRAK